VIVLIALVVGIYSALVPDASFAKPFIVFAVLGVGSYSMFTSLRAPKIAPRIDENGIRGGVVNSVSPFARTADTATKGEVIAPRDEAGTLANGQKLETAGVLQNAPAVQDHRGGDGNDPNPQRRAQLTRQPATASPSPSLVSPPATLPSDLRPAKSPTTGTIERSRRRDAIAPLGIEGETGTNYLIKLVRVDGKDSILIFVRGGETYTTKVPLGTYNIRAAAGSIWYGRKDLFGPNTHLFRLRSKDGKQPNFVFSRQGNMIHGMRYQLKKVVEGNTEEETISRDEF
jgi:hypothetical protein